MERREAFYERYGWVLVVLVAVFIALAAVSYIDLGLQPVPDYQLALPEGRVSTRPLLEQGPTQLIPIFRNTLTEYGIMLAAPGILLIVIAAGTSRRRER